MLLVVFAVVMVTLIVLVLIVVAIVAFVAFVAIVIAVNNGNKPMRWRAVMQYLSDGMEACVLCLLLVFFCVFGG